MQRPTSVRVSSTTASAWVPLNRYSSTIQVMLGLLFSSNANLTCDVQYTTDQLVPQPCNITRAGTAATLKLTNHGLSVADSIVVTQSGDANLDGVFAVATVVDQNTITYTVSNTGLTVVQGTQVIPLRVLTHPVLAGATTNQASNFNQPAQAVRLKASSYTAGYADLTITPGTW